MKCMWNRGCFCNQLTTFSCLLRAIVVGDQVQVHVFGGLAVDLLEETQPLHVRVLLFGAVDQLALQVAQSGEQRDRAGRM